MPVYDIYSKRRKPRHPEDDVYIYNAIPSPLRVQIVNILKRTLGSKSECNTGEHNEVYKTYRFMVNALRQEYGVLRLIDDVYDVHTEWTKFILYEEDCERVLDAIELSFRMIDGLTRDYKYRYVQDSDIVADDAMEEVNVRFKEQGVGYQYEDGKIIKIDSTFVHQEIVKPALLILAGENYKGPRQEFLAAHEHYRHGKSKESINEALKAFESMMKAICKKRGWACKESDTAKILIGICFDNELIPKFWQTKMNSLRSLLESSVPTGRNKMSGHGQGPKPKDVPEYLNSYILNMTASTLRFLAEAEERLA